MGAEPRIMSFLFNGLHPMSLMMKPVLNVILPCLALAVVATLVTRASITSREIGDLDEAHHLMDGMFFADLIADHPLDRLAGYPFEYYRQYPALGFTFWPPFYPFVEGVFFRVYGLDIIAARLCIVSFCLLLCWCMYKFSVSRLGPFLAVLSVSLTLTTPLMAEHCNMIMLEIPTLAMAFLTVVLYRRVVERGRWRGWGEICLFSLCAAATIYTKQTIIFLLPAILIDVALNRCELLRNRQTWISIGLLLALCLPLALFTLKYGGVNLAQSFGGRGDIYVASHRGASRWTVAGWTYYLRLLPVVISPLLCALAGAALVYGVVKTRFLRENGLIIGWFVSWYLLFSLLDNKQSRFILFVVPAVVLLGMNFLLETTRRSKPARVIVYCGIVMLFITQTVSLTRAHSIGYSGIDRIVFDTLNNESSGNIAYIGHFRQMFVPWVRILDSECRVYVLQGEDIAAISPDFASACRDFRVQWIFVEDSSDQSQKTEEIRNQLAGSHFEVFRHETFGPIGAGIKLKVYRYRGTVAPRMKTVPLRSQTQGISHS